MTDLELIHSLSDAEIVALTIWGESRNESHIGRTAIAHVVENRVKAKRPGYGLTARAVCLRPWQFSCWTPKGGVINYGRVMDAARALFNRVPLGPALLDCLAIVDTLDGIPDPTEGATHYMTRQQFEDAPKWARGLTPCASIGNHLFFKDVR
jgi:N-acetylmuramoyl-L-alanine amidase